MLRDIAVAVISGATYLEVMALNLSATYNTPSDPTPNQPVKRASYRMANSSESVPGLGDWLSKYTADRKAHYTSVKSISRKPRASYTRVNSTVKDVSSSSESQPKSETTNNVPQRKRYTRVRSSLGAISDKTGSTKTTAIVPRSK